ncbi:MAG: MFS transporter [Proteobacteria bacterium]|nr:MFS transporter [Pseudomonadota bacterium]
MYQTGVNFGLLVGMGLGGLVADRLGWRAAFVIAGAPGLLLAAVVALTLREPRGYLWVPAVSSVAALPLLLGVYATDTAGAALTLLAPAIALQFGYSAVGYALVQSLVQVRMRALASAITLFAINIFGSGLGPFVCGWLSDALQPRFGDESVRYSLAILSFGLLWAAVHYLQAARSYADDLRAKDRRQPIPSSSDVRSM